MTGVGNFSMIEVVNFWVDEHDGRIEGYPPAIGMTSWYAVPTFYVHYFRGGTGYGANSFADNGDGTATDRATGLMWSQTDSGAGMDWEHALAWAQTKNGEKLAGYSDWRLPNTKELQSLSLIHI